MPGADDSSLDNAIILGTSGSSQNITSQGQNAYTVTFLEASVTTHHQIQKQEDLLLNPTVVTSYLGNLATPPREGTHRKLIMKHTHIHTH